MEGQVKFDEFTEQQLAYFADERTKRDAAIDAMPHPATPTPARKHWLCRLGIHKWRKAEEAFSSEIEHAANEGWTLKKLRLYCQQKNLNEDERRELLKSNELIRPPCWNYTIENYYRRHICARIGCRAERDKIGRRYRKLWARAKAAELRKAEAAAALKRIVAAGGEDEDEDADWSGEIVYR